MNKKFKTFADAKFEIMRGPYSGIIGKIPLGSNGLEISIVMHDGSYGGSKGFWEIAAFDNNGQVDLKCLDHDVVGWLSFTELEKKIKAIQKELRR